MLQQPLFPQGGTDPKGLGLPGRNSRLLATLTAVFCVTLATFVGVLSWQLNRLAEAVEGVSGAVTPQLVATYQLSSDLASLVTLSSQLAERQTYGEAQTTFESLESRSEAVGWHLTSLRLAGVPVGPLSQAVRIHGELADDARTIYALVQQRLTLTERLNQHLQVAPLGEEGVSRAQRLRTSLSLLDRRINNLVSRGTQIAAQLTPMISILTNHIQGAQQERIAENRRQMDQMVYLLLFSSLALVIIFLALVLVLYRRLVVRLRRLWLAVKDWQNGASPQLLPHGRDEIAQIGRLMLDITEARPLTVASSHGLQPLVDGGLGLLGHDAFVNLLGQVCDQAKETRIPAWLFLGRIHQCDAIFADHGSAVGSAVFQHVAKQWAYLGGAGSIAGCLNGRDLGLVIQGLSEEEAAALAASLWQMVSDRPVSLRNGLVVPVRLLVGYDCCRGIEGRGLPEGLLARADNALMKSKKILWQASQEASEGG